MKLALGVGVPLVVPGFAWSFWYVGARMHVLFGLTSRRLVVFSVAAGVVASGIAVLGAASSASPVIGLLNVLGGYVCVFYLFLLLALLCLHAIQLRWNPPPVRSGVAVLALAFATTGAGGLRASSFTVNETEIQVLRLEREVTVMQISDVHLGHHRGQAFLERIVEETNRRRPDLVLITGDLIDSTAALEPGVLEPRPLQATSA